jgi:hypothetical protein
LEIVIDRITPFSRRWRGTEFALPGSALGHSL